MHDTSHQIIQLIYLCFLNSTYKMIWKDVPIKFYHLKRCVFKFYKHTGWKECYFFYKYHINIGINKLKNNFILSLFFSTRSLFKFIKNKT
jgi:hypothetical protein